MAPRSADEMVLGTTEGGEREEEAGVQRKPSGGEVLAMWFFEPPGFGAYRRDGAGWCSMPCARPIIATHIPAPQPTAMPNDPGRTGEILGVTGEGLIGTPEDSAVERMPLQPALWHSTPSTRIPERDDGYVALGASLTLLSTT